MANIDLPANEWVLLPITKAAFIRHRSGKGLVIYCQSPNEPSDFLAFDDSTLGKVVTVDMVVDGEFIYAKSLNQPSVIVISSRESSSSPDGLFSGLRAMNVQFYDESNKKLGKQWEASRIVTASGGQQFLTILKTGSKTVALKKREFVYSGVGLTANIYINPAYTSGTPDPIYNMRPFYGAPETQLLVGASISNKGSLCGAPIYDIGNRLGIGGLCNSLSIKQNLRG